MTAFNDVALNFSNIIPSFPKFDRGPLINAKQKYILVVKGNNSFSAMDKQTRISRDAWSLSERMGWHTQNRLLKFYMYIWYL